MARIPEQEVEQLKRSVSMERLVRARGVELEQEGGVLVGRCPLHKPSASGSLIVSPAENTWQCTGACHMRGSVIDWVMRSEGVTFRHAVELLRADLPTVAAADQPVVKASTVAKLPCPIDFAADDQGVLGQVLGYYHETLKSTPDALEYLRSRGLQRPDLVEHFKLGFGDRSLGYRLPDKKRVAGAQMRGRLQQLGILRETGHEEFNGSVVVPILDEEGGIVEVYGRKIAAGLRAGTPTHTYLHEAPEGIFHVEALRDGREIILCGSVIDALTFWCAGFGQVVGTFGASGSMEVLLEALGRHGTERVLIAFRRDEAGDRAAVALAERLTAQGIESFRVQFPHGMDANDYAVRVAPAARSLDLVLRKAGWLGKGRTASLPLAAREPAPAAREASPGQVCSPPPAPAAAEPDAPGALASMDDLTITIGDRRYRVRGLGRNKGPEQLKVNILCGQGEAFFIDTVDLYQARQRTAYEKQVSIELGVSEAVIKSDLGRLLLRLEELQDERNRKPAAAVARSVELSQAEVDAALARARSPHFVDELLEDFERCGVVGEHTNKLVGYLAATSRKLEEPLAVLVQSSSAAGKSSLMDAVLAFMPEEDCIRYSAMTGQSLFYMGKKDLKHKILAIAEEEGAKRASYALKLLQSEGELNIASTVKDPETGQLGTQECHVEGPVGIFMTTTSISIDEELLNRCVVLTVDEERDQTQAIHKVQREAKTLEGLVARKRREKILALHRNIQRVLRPLAVVNPHAPKLNFADGRTRTRRDHAKYLTLISTIALLHQHQRQVLVANVDGERLEYIEATWEDIALANRLTSQLLGRSLDDMPPQTRRFLELVHGWVRGACAQQGIAPAAFRFSRREVRGVTGLSQEQVRVHLERLVELEYVVVHRGTNGQSFVYELAYEPATPTMRDLPEIGGDLPAQNGHLPDPYRPATGALPDPYRTPKPRQDPLKDRSDRTFADSTPKTLIRGGQAKIVTYPNGAGPHAVGEP